MKQCKLCNRKFKNFRALGVHIKIKHKLNVKDYYDEFLIRDNEGICKICGNNTKFIYLSKGYNLYCCKFCRDNDEELKEKREQTNLKRYGVKNASQSKEIQNKKIKTNLDRYGVENFNLLEEQKSYLSDCGHNKSDEEKNKIQNKKIKTNLDRYGVEHGTQTEEFKAKMKQTCLERYGVENISQTEEFKEFIKNYGNEERKRNRSNLLKNIGLNKTESEIQKIQQKRKQTCLDRYEVESPLQCKEIINKVKQTNLKRYGVENPSQCKEIINKIKQTCLDRYGVEYPFQSVDIMSNVTYQRKDYKLPSGKIVKVQGYEPYAIDILLLDYPEDDLLINDINIKEYIGLIRYKNKHIYGPDIYIIPENRIIEVKSGYTLQDCYKNIMEKLKHCLDIGFNMNIGVIENKELDLII